MPRDASSGSTDCGGGRSLPTRP
uniref:Uncharacterized protein n=1 Tax=Arundo donax TaxID=35708 RepID=A0A0A8ZQE0_ARUDO